jgi:hypothetical protein
VLQYSGLLGPGTALIAFGFKTVTNTTKHNAPMPNVKHLELLSYSLLRIFHFALRGRII